MREGKKEEDEMEDEGRVAPFFGVCTSLRWWMTEARADRFGLRSQLPATLT